MVNVARGGVKEADAMLEDQYLVAPCDGIITVVYPHASELVMTGAPIMTLQQDDTFMVFNVRETLLKDIKRGTKYVLESRHWTKRPWPPCTTYRTWAATPTGRPPSPQAHTTRALSR